MSSRASLGSGNCSRSRRSSRPGSRVRMLWRVATASPSLHIRSSARRRRRRGRWTFVAVVAVALLGFVAAVLALSGVTLADDAIALARVDVQMFGGTIERVQAFGPNGQRITIAVRHQRLTPG